MTKQIILNDNLDRNYVSQNNTNIYNNNNHDHPNNYNTNRIHNCNNNTNNADNNLIITNREIADIFVDKNLDLNGIQGNYSTDESSYKPFMIFGNVRQNEKNQCDFQNSTTGSLSSITTTSLASSEPDPGSDLTGNNNGGIGGGCGGSGNGNNGGDGVDGIVPGINNNNNGGPATGVAASVSKPEEWWQTTLQVSIPFFVAGIGTIGAGIILGRVEHWEVFKHISELFILVPALLGLKGNLDMCLASRLSTQANLGNMSSTKDIIQMVIGNVALVQVQATVAAFIVSVFAIAVGGLMNGTFEFDHAMLIIASSMFTATSSCFVLDFVLVAVILLSIKFKMNPDNLATPLAASIGDVVSISILSFIASLLFTHIETHIWVAFIVVGSYFLLLPFWVIIVLNNRFTKTVLSTGWIPVLSALFISGMGGLVLDAAVTVFRGFVVFQPIINGIGGNLVSVQASKISTMLHQSSILGIVPPHSKILEMPWRALINGVPYAKTARILILMSIPGQILFIYVADYIHMEESTIGLPFVLSYLCVSLVQIMTLLYTAHIIIHAMWKWKIDPDNSAIPYLTALGDLLGSSLLALAFLSLRWMGAPYSDRPDVEDEPDIIADESDPFIKYVQTQANFVGVF